MSGDGCPALEADRKHQVEREHFADTTRQSQMTTCQCRKEAEREEEDWRRQQAVLRDG